MGRRDREARGVGGLPASRAGRADQAKGTEEPRRTALEAARKAWLFILVAVLLAGTLLAWALQPSPKVNNKTIIQKQQTRIVPTLIPVPRSTVIVREQKNTTIKPGPTVTKTATPRPRPRPTRSPSPSPSPTCRVQVVVCL